MRQGRENAFATREHGREIIACYQGIRGEDLPGDSGLKPCRESLGEYPDVKGPG